MNKNFNQYYKQICDNISSEKLADAFIQISPFIENVNNNDIKENFNKQFETYHFFLEYKLKGISDPDSSKILKNIQRQLIDITERLKDEYYLSNSSDKLSQEKRKLEYEQKINQSGLVNELSNFINLNKDSENSERRNLLSKLFLSIWLTDSFTEEEKNRLKKYATSNKVFNHEKCVIVSVLTISLLRRFDNKKFHLLFDFYDTSENLVWNRALTGIIMAYFVYEKRMGLYNEIMARIQLISEDKNIQKHTENIILQLARTKETEKISKKLHDEIIPEMQKFQPKIQDKLRLDDIIAESSGEDKNPDWEEIFDEAPGLLDKMADISKLQLEGSDVFMSAFSMFKQFPFFRDHANWFVPFYKENPEVINSFENIGSKTEIETFTKGLENSAFMCNSDKYSFCMNIKMMPESQRSMILDLFIREIEQMKEISDEDSKIFKNVKDKHIFTQYIQDLYRFYKLHPLHHHFEDFFGLDTNFYNSNLFEILINNENFLITLGDLYFQKGFYSEAILIFEKFRFEGKIAQKNFEKIGFSYQKLNNFRKALENYSKAEIFDIPSLWLVKKMAFCYRKINDFQNALKYYLTAEISESENLIIQAGIGHCYLSLNDYDNALKKYFKVEFYEPNNIKVMKPIAWCSLMTGKFETSIKYYKKVCKHKPDVFDWINFGHALYCSNLKNEAIDKYLWSIKASDIRAFETAMIEDKLILMKHSVSEPEIDLLIEYVKAKAI